MKRLNPKLRKALRRYGDSRTWLDTSKVDEAEATLIDVIREMLVRATIRADAAAGPEWHKGVGRQTIADEVLYDSGDETDGTD